MSANRVVGRASIALDGNSIVDLGTEQYASITFPNDLTVLEIGFNGNAIYGRNEAGEEVELQIVALVGGDFDKYITNWNSIWKKNPALTKLLTLQVTLQIGDGSGTASTTVYRLSGGFVKKYAEVNVNATGAKEQGQRNYTLGFSNYTVLA
jgi:hypothetical protein